MFLAPIHSACHSRYPPLYLIRVLAVLLLNALQPTNGQTPVITGKCLAQCELNRPYGVEESFGFKCEQVYKSEEDQENCRYDCESCPKEVCDETSTYYLNVGATDWRCPAVALNEICFNHCSNNRPKGRRESYTLDCDSEFPGDDLQRQECKDKCSSCPSFVCQKNKPNIFNCPYEKMKPECKKQCDKVRDYGELGGKDFRCDRQYNNPHDQQACQDTCRNHCPKWVCDAKCPTLQIEDRCLDFCKRRRRDKYVYSGDAFELDDCSNIVFSKCDVGCAFCQFDSDNGKGPLCYPVNYKHFKCPKQDPDETEFMFYKRSYKGICQDRCERSRTNGIGPFKIDCEKAYTNFLEKRACEHDCNSCYSHINGCEGKSINCRGTLQYRKEIAEKEKKVKEREEQKSEEDRRHHYKISEEEDKVGDVKREESLIIVVSIIGIVVGLILLCGVYAGLLRWRRNKNIRRQQIQNVLNYQATMMQPITIGVAPVPVAGSMQTPT